MCRNWKAQVVTYVSASYSQGWNGRSKGSEVFQRSKLTMESEFIDEFLHCLFLALDGFNQFELGAASVEIVRRPMNSEVSIATEVIRQEAEPDFECDQFAGKCDVGFFGLGEELSSARPIALSQFLEHGHLHFDLREVLLIFEGWAGGGTDHIAEIVKRTTGHDSIEIDDAHGFASEHIHHDVVEFCVVVGDAFGDFPLGHRVQDDIDNGLAFQSEVGFRLRFFRAVVVIFLEGVLESSETLSRIVEIGNRLEEASAGKIDEQALKFAECLAGLIGLIGGLDGFVRFDSFNEKERAPDAIVAV